MSKRLYMAARRRLTRERGAVQKDWGGRIPIVLVYPNLYSVGMSNLGFLTLYGLLNRHGDVVCERAFLPDREEGDEFVRTGTRLFSLETQRPLEAFDIIAFSLSYENDYPHVAAILAMAGIPAIQEDRTESHPLVMAGGPAVFINPEPVAECFDFLVLGEAEEVLEEILEQIRKSKEPRRRQDLLHALPDIEGVYVPSLFRPTYNEDGTLASFEAAEGVSPKIRRRWVRDLDKHPTVTTVSTPDTEFSGIHLVEVGRGCPRLCRFCSTGFIYRPVRYRSLEALKPELCSGIDQGARLGLVTASLGDYPELESLCHWIPGSGGSISAPSLRLDSLSDSLLETLRVSGQKTVTLAPEAGSDRLRRILNKSFTDNEILETIDRLADHGIFSVRLYFMVGLPGEQEEDVDGIIDLAKQVRHRFLGVAKDKARMGTITLSVNPFVPKPWSAFQWCPMDEEGAIKGKLKKVRRALQKEPNISVTQGLAKWAYLQALFSRGDRRVHRFVMAGGGGETNWRQLFRTSSLNPDFYVCRERPQDELFPWDFIDQGISKQTLYREYCASKAMSQKIGP